MCCQHMLCSDARTVYVSVPVILHSRVGVNDGESEC